MCISKASACRFKCKWAAGGHAPFWRRGGAFPAGASDAPKWGGKTNTVGSEIKSVELPQTIFMIDYANLFEVSG